MLHSPRLIYSQLTAEDEALSIKMAQNPEVMAYIKGRALTLREARERFQEQLAINRKYKDLGFLKAVSKENGSFVGYLKMVLMEPKLLEVGYALLPEYWGQGYASEMLQAMLDFPPNRTNYKQFLGVVNMDNLASIQVLEKLGFVFKENNFIGETEISYYIKKNR